MQNSNAKFLDKRRFIIISVSMMISIALTVVTLVGLLKIDFSDLFSIIGNNLAQGKLYILWFVFLGLYVPFKFVSVTSITMIRVKTLKIKISFWEQFLYALTNCFLSFVTPANFVTDPYTMFWLKTNGLSNIQSSAIILSNAVKWQIIQMIVTFPSLVIIAMNYEQITSYVSGDTQSGLIIFWMMMAGLGLDVIILAVLTTMAFNKKTQMYAAVVFNKIKQILRMKYHTTSETKAKYLNRGEFNIQIMSFLRDIKSTLIICLILFITEIAFYLLLCDALLLVVPADMKLDIGQIFNEANVAITANKFVPLPGNQLSLEYCLLTLMKAENISTDPKIDEYINNSVILWRASSVYVPGGIGFFGMAWLTYTQFKRTKKTGKLF